MSDKVKITDITKTKKGYNALFCDEGFLFSVDDVILAQEKITIGREYDQWQLDSIAKHSSREKAAEKCYDYLSVRMHSKKELTDKLRRKFDKDSARRAVEKMERLGLVDDLRFAMQKAEYLLNVKRMSLRRTRAKLSCLGIDKGTVDSVLSSFGIDDQVEDISALLQGKYASKLGQPQKVAASLMRKGFRYSDIKKAMEMMEIDIYTDTGEY